MKKIKKIFILFLLAIMITGCDVEYNLDINSEKAIEKMVITLEKNPENKKISSRVSEGKISAYYDNDYDEPMFYDIKKKEKKDTINLIYNYEYQIEKVKFSNAVGQCFYNKNITKDKKFITINTSEGVNCIYKDVEKQIDNLTININTIYEVVETNADIVKGNKYTWNINSDNYNEKSIYMKIDYTKEKKSTVEKNVTLIASIILVLTVLSFALLVYFKIRRNKKYE